MKQIFKGKTRLVLTIAICVLFIATAFSGAAGNPLSERNSVREMKEQNTTITTPSDPTTGPFRPLPLPPWFYKIVNPDWNFWDNLPDMYAIPIGNVGIGTSSPTEKLQVVGIIYSTTGGFKFPDGTIQTTAATSGDGNTLDEAYDEGGSGAGRTITADSGAVNISGPDGLTVNGNIGIGTTDPLAELTVNGSIIRKIAVATGLGPNDDTDEGQIISRVLNFTKLYDGTAIRIGYYDNFRVMPGGYAARWEIRIDGVAPPGGGIYQDVYIGQSVDIHRPGTILGYATGVPAGSHEIQIWVGPSPGYPIPNAYTGWKESRWTIEAEEVWIQ